MGGELRWDEADDLPAALIENFDGVWVVGVVGSMSKENLREGVPVEVNIWESPTGAALVRRHAHGNETVPTVDVAGTVLVNPASSVVVACAERAGIRLPAPAPRWWRRGSPSHAVRRGTGGE